MRAGEQLGAGGRNADCGRTVTVAVADFVESATEVAVTNTWAGLGTDNGAVYRPPLLIVPQAEPAQPDPPRLQVTAVLEVLDTVAVNCCCFPATTPADVGDTLTATGKAIVTVAEPDFEGSATETACTVT